MSAARRRTEIIILISILTALIIIYAAKITYSVYITRQKIAEGFLLVSTIQNTLNDYATQNAGFPTKLEMDNLSFGLPKPLELKGTYISSVVTFKEANSEEVNIFAAINTKVIENLEDGNDSPLNSPYLKFAGVFDGKTINWKCTSNLAKRYLPENCSGT